MRIWQRLKQAFPLVRRAILSKCRADLEELDNRHNKFVERTAQRIETLEMDIIVARERGFRHGAHAYDHTISELSLTPEQFFEVHAKVKGMRDGTQWGVSVVVDQHMVFMLRMSDQEGFPQLIASHLANELARKLVTWAVQEWKTALEEQRKDREHVLRRAERLRSLGTRE